MDLNGKVAIVTGASAGIGAATVKALHGIGMKYSIIDGDESIWKNIMDTNFNSVLMCCREAIKNMRENDVDGYIINVSSITGVRALDFPGSSVYSASKFALCAMTENLRLELVRMGSKIRTTCMNPGVVKTEIFEASGLSKEASDELIRTTPHLLSEDVANTIKFLVQSPPHVQISNLTIQPVGEKF